MPQGISLHIGLNSVDPRQYEGWDGQLLTACEADAKDMQARAKKQKLSVEHQPALDPGRHCPGPDPDAMLGAAEALKSGDLFFPGLLGSRRAGR